MTSRFLLLVMLFVSPWFDGAFAQQPTATLTPYQYANSASTFAAAPTDWITITGSNTKKVTITAIDVCGNVGPNITPATVPISIIKRSTLDTSGTSTPATGGNLADLPTAATAIVAVYTANPTLGTTQATVNVKPLNAGPPGSSGCTFFQYGPSGNAGPFIVLSAGHQVAINFQGQTLPSGFTTTWTISTTEQ